MAVLTPASAFVCLCLFASAGASAQNAPTPSPYRPNTADEDWTFLKTAPKTDPWDPIKYIGLGRPDWSLSLSGEFRLRPEGFRVHPTDDQPSASDGYLLQRYLFGGDLRLGPRVRVFGELQSGIIDGRLRSPRPTDRDTLDVHQLFFQWRQNARTKSQLVLTAGRQEVEIGSSRLISASPGLNVKRSFDGVVMSYRAPSWTLAGVAAALVRLRGGAFDDGSDTAQRFWGVAATRSGPLLERSDVGVYYLGVDRRVSVFAQGAGQEVRHTIGGKWAGSGSRVDLNYDALFQWGHFAGAPTRAWAFATETGVRLRRLPWRLRLSIRSDIASGDRDSGSPDLQSFDPLFPGNSYSGAVGLFGPTNLTDLTPALTISPRSTFTFGLELPSSWRTSTADGVYSTDLRVLVPPQAGTGSYVGTNPALLANWQLTRHLEAQGAITRFHSGGFLARTFVSAGFGFYSVTARYRF
jgi:hypothetical protein